MTFMDDDAMDRTLRIVPEGAGQQSPAQVEYRKAILPARPYYKPSLLQRMPTELAAIIRWAQVMVQA